MTASPRALRAILDDFLDGAPFWPFWNSFMDHQQEFEPERHLSPAGCAAYERLCDLVAAATADTAAPVDHAEGRVGEAALRERLRDLQLETIGGTLL